MPAGSRVQTQLKSAFVDAYDRASGRELSQIVVSSFNQLLPTGR